MEKGFHNGEDTGNERGSTR